MVVFLAINLFMGLLIVVLGIPLFRGQVAPNSAYGLRIKETLDSKQVWYAANKYAGRSFVILGSAQILLTVGLAFFPWSSPEVYAAVLAFFFIFGLLGCAAWAIDEARKIHSQFSKSK